MQHFEKGGGGVLLLLNIRNAWPVYSKRTFTFTTFRITSLFTTTVTLTIILTNLDYSTMTSSATFYSYSCADSALLN